ncbi:S41 family peptidase, partial [Gemmatimonadota bacterium]
ASLVESMDRAAFWRRLAETIALFGDGHTSASPPYEIVQAYMMEGGRLFPWEIDLQDRQAFVTREFLAEPLIPPGSEVMEINERPIGDLIDELGACISAEKQTTRVEFLERNLVNLFTLVYGWGESFTLRITPPDGESRTVTASGITVTEYQANSGRQAGARGAPWAFQRLEEGRIGYLDFRSFSDPDGFARFLEEMFSDISNDPVEALIIDLRLNGGGNSRLGDMLLGYLTGEPWIQVARMDIKMSRQIKAYYRSGIPRIFRWAPGFLVALANRGVRQMFSARTGEIVSFHTEPSHPPDNPLRYNGKVYVLTGPRTFSSATMFATTVKDHGFATLVGEETGGLASHFGDVYTFYLPHTRLRLGVSHKFFLRPSREDDGRGCLPDVEVITTPDDRAAGRDPVLERTLGMIPPG